MRLEATGINYEVCKGPYVNRTGKYYYLYYLNIKLFMLALPLVLGKKKKLNTPYPNFYFKKFLDD